MWSELTQAYESKLAVLEEARAAYSAAVADVVAHAGPAMENAIREVLVVACPGCQVEAVIAESGGNAVLAQAPWSCITIRDESSNIEFRIAAWVASSWGGPDQMLRVALSLQGVHGWLDLPHWIRRSGEMLSEGPGEVFDPLDWQRFPESSPDWRAIRIVSIALDDRDSREIAREAAAAARALSEPIGPMVGLIGEAALPMMRAENALMRYRPELEAKVAHAGVAMWPSKNLGGWQGGKYLQVGSFWLATDPSANRLIAACSKEDNEVVSALATKLGETTGRQGASLCVTVLTEDELRGSDAHIDEVVSASFDFWFNTKGSELSASAAAGEQEPLERPVSIEE